MTKSPALLRAENKLGKLKSDMEATRQRIKDIKLKEKEKIAIERAKKAAKKAGAKKTAATTKKTTARKTTKKVAARKTITKKTARTTKRK